MISVAAIASVFFIAGTAAKSYASLTLLNRYRPGDYVTDARARALCWMQFAGAGVAGAAAVTLAFCTRLWWVELPLCALVAALYWRLWRVLRRFAGKFHEAGEGIDLRADV